ncbi:Glucosamine-6-phosphate isomerase (Glucosamine-6-phosphate deaminase) (GNPDA) (GlcN6P deaminase) [Mucor velutinosus]|uniref:Glucosamine-6-phosphate isomerase (Glucosamine-6-phosphate deaminase) (GNPDA) (GlcN6P deaminase) n=1 Tax=Mucor velutinosus TaxID=708070 RepID=A0AAN7DF20_9FUNG|nr:Glucosamine-6-phosphate isomerase (Glucosamine-6-phosphate deaminase) (GNPDA) (GlcN6P deaminase) [Mucor velutinosus]
MLDVDEIPEKPNVNTLDSVISGLFGGLAGLAVGHPFVKVRLQSRELASRYKGTWNCFITTIKQEKFVGLYKGMASPAVGVAGVNALVFGSYTSLMQYQQEYDKDSSSSSEQLPPLRHVLFAGMGAGVITSFVTCPMELVKVQLQSQTQVTAIKGPIDCLKNLYTTGGIRYCFKGMLPTTLRELSFGPYFLTYEFICRIMTTSDPNSINNSTYELSGPKIILAGGSAGIVAWCSTYFADVVKTRIQSEPERYKGFIDCIKSSYRNEGWRIFFRGLTPTILRAFPSNAATFAAYTWTMKLCQSSQLTAVKQQHNKNDAILL